MKTITYTASSNNADVVSVGYGVVFCLTITPGHPNGSAKACAMLHGSRFAPSISDHDVPTSALVIGF